MDSSKKEDTNKSSKADEPKNSYTIDGITITANNFSVEPYDDANGTYTKRISVMFNIKNDTDKAFGYIKSCEGRLSDGFKLESWTNIQDLDLKQVPSNGSVDDVAYLLADDSITLDKIAYL